MIRWVLHLPRGMGRTEHLVDLVKKHNGVLVTSSVGMVENMKAKFGLRDDQVCSYRQLPDWTRGRDLDNRPFYIDDVDWLLQDLLGISNIDGVTIAMPDKDEVVRNGYRLPEIKTRWVVQEEPRPFNTAFDLKSTMERPWFGGLDLANGPDRVMVQDKDRWRPYTPEDTQINEVQGKKGVLKKISRKGGGSKSRKPRRRRRINREPDGVGP